MRRPKEPSGGIALRKAALPIGVKAMLVWMPSIPSWSLLTEWGTTRLTKKTSDMLVRPLFLEAGLGLAVLLCRTTNIFHHLFSAALVAWCFLDSGNLAGSTDLRVESLHASQDPPELRDPR